jgi:hypothetical protein
MGDGRWEMEDGRWRRGDVIATPFTVLGAAAEQEDEKQDRNWNSQEPKKNVARSSCLFDSFI